jgi:hypothetical protein
MAYLETQPDQALINHTNQIIQAWQESAEDVLKKFQESLAQIPTDKGSLGDEFEFVPYHSIHKKPAAARRYANGPWGSACYGCDQFPKPDAGCAQAVPVQHG